MLTPHVHEVHVSPGGEVALHLVPKVEGEYWVFCSIQGHREDGMEALFTIY